MVCWPVQGDNPQSYSIASCCYLIYLFGRCSAISGEFLQAIVGETDMDQLLDEVDSLQHPDLSDLTGNWCESCESLRQVGCSRYYTGPILQDFFSYKMMGFLFQNNKKI